MSTIITRIGKGTPLTNAEVDTNFTNLNTDKIEAADTRTLTNKTISGANNTLSNIGNSSLTNSSITFGSTAQALGSTVSALNGVSIGATTASTGAFTTLTSTGTTTLNGTTIPASKTLADTDTAQTLTNKTLSTGTAITGGTINNTVIGGTTRAAGNFTTLDANGNVVLGDATSDTISANGRFNTDVVPSTDNARDLGTSSLKWRNVFAGTVTADNIIAPNVAAIGQFSWDNNATTTPVAKPQVTPSSTLIASIHGRMRGCLLLDNGQVNYYLNPSNWAQKEDGSASVLTGADGMVMVEIPAFYVKNESSGTLWKPVISATPLPGYDLHPAFIKDGVAVPYRYYSAYDACVFRASDSTYIAGLNLDNNSGNVNTTNDKLASVSGVYPMVGLTRNEFRLLAANRGTGWRVGDYALWSAIGLLLAVEAQTLNSQGVYGAGNTGGSYIASSSNQNDSPHTIAGAGNALGNGSTDTTSGAASNNKPGTAYCKYRGIENFWGNCWNWTDGINIFSEGNSAGNKVFAYWSNNRANFADNTATNYGLLGEIANTLANTRYATQFSQTTTWSLVPTNFSTTSSHGTTDIYFTNSGWRVLRVGGRADDGGLAGAFAFDGSNTSGARSRNSGARLAF